MMAVVFLGLHVLTTVLDTVRQSVGWAAIVVPFASSYGRFWVGVGAITLDLMIAVFATGLLRTRMRPGTWRCRALARLPELARGPGAHVRDGNGRRSEVGHRARHGLVSPPRAALAWRLRGTARQCRCSSAHASVGVAPPTASRPDHFGPEVPACLTRPIP